MKEKYIYFYYIVLLLVLVSWTNPNTSPSFMVRLLYMASLFLPTVIWKQSWLPAVFTCFISISQYGISYSYLPDTVATYMWLALLLFMLYGHKNKLSLAPLSLLVLPIYVLTIDFTTNGEIHHIFYVLIVACILLYFFSQDYNDASFKMSIAFIVTTIVLCYYFLFFKDTFSQSLGKYDTDLERISWTDPNYLGCVIGMGVMCCIIRLRESSNKLYIRALICFTIALSIVVMIMNASRGALVAISLGIAYYLFVSKIKISYKIIFSILIIGFIYYLYNNSYFDLLMYRIQNDETGSGRSEIWVNRLTAFFSGSFLNIVFGYGQDEAMTLGTSITIGCHNDYVAFLTEYGLIGFILFIYTLTYPLIKSKVIGGDNTHIVASTIYLASCCFTLEPFSLGRIPYYMFYISIILLVNRNYKNLKERIL